MGLDEAADRTAWCSGLPAKWRDAVVVPLEMKTHRDYEADAVRTLGRDEDGELCFSTHRYVLRELRSDDGDDFFLAPIYGEALRAWRLRDGRWLLHRIVAVGEELENARGFFALSESAPR
jgi:hypothetical protein